MNKVKMILTNKFDSDVRVLKEAKYLTSKGFDVEVLCWDRENDYLHLGVDEVEGVKIRRFFPYSKYGTGYKQIIPYIKFIRACIKYLKRTEYQYLHCHDLDGIIVGYFVRRGKHKLIFDMHEIYEVQGRNQKLRYLIRILVNYLQNKSDYIIYVNEVQKETMFKRNHKKLIYVPNYPDHKEYPESEKTESGILRISYIGAVRHFKELKKLIDCAVGIEDIKVGIHGGGVAYKRLNEIKSNYYNVEVTGLYHYKDSGKLYNQSDILYIVYPMSVYQNKVEYPTKFFEAIITKTPIIVSKGSVLEQFLKQHDIGFVVDGSKPQDITSLINNINDNRDILRVKQKELSKIQYEYIWDKIVVNLDKAYQ